MTSDHPNIRFLLEGDHSYVLPTPKYDVLLVKDDGFLSIGSPGSWPCGKANTTLADHMGSVLERILLKFG